MKGFDDLYRRILPRVKGAAMPVIDQAIREAANEFFRRTRLWRCDDEFKVSRQEDEFVAAPSGSAIFEFEDVRFNGDIVEPKSIAWLNDNVPRWRELDADIPKWVTQTSPNTLRLVPGAAGTVSVSLFLELSNDAERAPDFMINQHAKLIADGALGELFTIPGDHANPGLAQFHTNRFQARLDSLFDSHAAGQQSAPTRTRARFL